MANFKYSQSPNAYKAALPGSILRVREEPAHYYGVGDCWSERHLQCVWYDERFRPAAIETSDGEPVFVESAGRWNLEAGPDFLDAVLIVGQSKRRIIGDVEIHIRPSDWQQHGHSDDPRYSNVVAHVTYFTGPRPRALPPHVAAISLRDALSRNTAFSFDSIDIGAYPYALIPRTPRPCFSAWGDDPDRALALLKAAGFHRLQLKKQRMEMRADFYGSAEQALYEAVLAALGYKQNAGAMRTLSRRYPLSEFAHDLSLTPLDHYARLLSVAGLLEPIDAAADEATAQRLSDLWHRLWEHPLFRGDAAPIKWGLASTRPQNHPARRLVAAATLFCGENPIARLWDGIAFDNPKWFKLTLERLVAEASLPGFPKPIGADRAATIMTNAIIPWLMMTQDLPDELYDAIPAETINSNMKLMASRLLGPDHSPAAFYARSGLMQQGLLQIYNDFCLNLRAGCAACRLAKCDASPSSCSAATQQMP